MRNVTRGVKMRKVKLRIILPVIVMTVLAVPLGLNLLAQESTDSLMPSLSLCQSKTSYNENLACSDKYFIANNMSDLEDYASSFGLEGNQYRGIRIRFSLNKRSISIHSPCLIDLGENITHSVKDICLDGKKGVRIRENSLFDSKRIHILSSGGDSIIEKSSVIKADELEIFTAKKLSIDRGVRINLKKDARLISTSKDNSIISFRLRDDSVLKADNLTISTYGKIHFKDSRIDVKRDIEIKSIGETMSNSVSIATNGRFNANNITIEGGNNFKVENKAFLLARNNLHINANGCSLTDKVKLKGTNFSGSCLEEKSNQAPTAIISTDHLTGKIPFTVTLDASSSSDSDGDIKSYLWEFSDGTMANGVSVQKEFTQAGSFTVTLTTTDDDGATGIATVVINATTPLSPVAVADVNPIEGEAPLTVNLDASASDDPDGDIMRYEWIFDDGEILTGEMQTRTFDSAGTYTVSLKVTDDDGLTHQSDGINITVSALNNPPMMIADQTFTVRQNVPSTFTLHGATDVERATLTYSVVNNPDSGTLSGCLSDTSELTCTFTPEPNFFGRILFTYRANDGEKDSSDVSVVTINVHSLDNRPIAIAGENKEAKSGEVIVFNGGDSYDPDEESITYSWDITHRPIGSNVILSNPTSKTPSIIVDRNGDYKVRLIVNDGEYDSYPDEITITVTGEGNVAPSLSQISSPKSFQVGTEIRFTISGMDADTDDNLYFSAIGLPKNAILNSQTGGFRFNPTPDQVGDHTVKFMISDGSETSSQDVILSVLSANPNQSTTLSSRVLDAKFYSEEGREVPLVGVKVSVEGSSKIAITDSDGRFTLTGIPHGALIVHVDASDLTAPNNDKYGNFAGRLRIMPNVNNRPYRDYMLPRVDAVGMAMVGPTKKAIVNNTNIKVKLEVPAGTAVNTDGTPYTGPLSVSEVPIDATPRELPEVFRPSQLLTLQPIGVRFTTPANITFPNNDNLPPDTLMDIFSLSEQGGFIKVGTGIVSQDGKTIDLVEGGIRSTTWHFVTVSIPEFIKVLLGAGGVGGRNNRLGKGCKAGSSICVATGILKEEHILPPFRDQGLTVAHKLNFKNPNSQKAPTLLPQFKYNQMTVSQGGAERIINQNPPQLMGMSYEVEGIATSPSFFQTQVLRSAPTSNFSVAGAIDTEGMPTGIYEAKSRLELISGAEDNPSVRMQKNDFTLPVISPETDFGMGWMLEDLHRLYGVGKTLDHNSKKVMLVHGNFNYLVFIRNDDGTYSSPPGDYSTLSAAPIPSDGFIRETKEGDQYVFDGDGYLLGKIDRYGRRMVYHYDALKKLSMIVHPSGRTTQFIYGADGLIDTITDPNGRVTTFEHDVDKNLIRITEPDMSTKRFEYNDAHALLAQMDKLNRATTYAYDGKGNVIRTIRPDGSSVSYESSATRLAGSDKGSMDNPFMVGLESDMGNRYIDSKGNITTFITNDYGDIVGQVNALGGRRSFVRDENNNLTLRTDENGNSVTYTYDTYGNLLTQTNPVGTVKFDYLANPKENFHQPVAITDAKGNKISISYGPYGNVIETRDAENNLTEFSYRRRYLLASTFNNSTKAGLHYRYDDNGNVKEIRDAYHQLLALNTYDNVGNLLASTDAMDNTTTFTYDSLSRVRTRTDAQNGVVTFNYDAGGNLLSYTDQKNKTSSFSYDDANNLVKRTDPLGMSEIFIYDTNRNLIERTDRNGNIIAYRYDSLNRPVSKIFPDGNKVSYSYDAKGNMLSSENPHAKLEFSYDELDRVTTAARRNLGITLGYSFDKNSNRVALIDASNIGFGDVSYDYNKRDYLVKLGHQFDRDPNGIDINYKGHRRESLIFPNGVSANYEWIPGKMNQLENLSNKKESKIISSFDYQYNLNDFVTEQTVTRSGISINSNRVYSYDSLNQLTSATKSLGTGPETFTYDIMGNRLQRDGDTTDSTFNDNHQLTDDKNFTYDYDNNGNLVKRVNSLTNEVMEFFWDYENRLIKVTRKPSAGATATMTAMYKYDSFGRRIEKDINGEITKYIHDGSHIYLELNDNNIVQARYLHGDNIDESLRMIRTNTPFKNDSFPIQEFYYHRDRSGNITEVTNYDGDVVQSYVYDSFGNPTIYDDKGMKITQADSSYLKNPFLFAGREYDSETGCYYYRARYFCPDMGRFISEELTGSDGPHLYWFNLNNPLNYIDPDGFEAVFFSWGGNIGLAPLYSGKGKVAETSTGFIIGSERTGYAAKAFITKGTGDRIAGGCGRFQLLQEVIFLEM